MGKNVKRGLKQLTIAEFHRKTNIITLLLLVYIIILIISTSKVMDRLGQIEIERSYVTGEATGNVSLKIIAESSSGAAAATTAAEEAAAVLSQPLTSSKTLMKFSPSKFLLDLHFGEKKTETLEVTNILDISLDLEFSSNLEEYILINPKTMHIEPDESKEISITFIGDKPGVVSGYINARGKTVKSYLLVILDISSAGLPGQVEINLPEQFKEVSPGENILVSVHLSGFAGDDVELSYILKNVENHEVFKVSQAITVKDMLNFDKTLMIPEDVPYGLYVIALELRHGGQTLVDSEIITISRSKEPVLETPGILEKRYAVTKTQFTLIVSAVIALIIIAAVLYAYCVKSMSDNVYGKKR